MTRHHVPDAERGIIEGTLRANGFTTELLVGLVRAEFATAAAETMKAGGKAIEVVRVTITDAGRKAIG